MQLLVGGRDPRQGAASVAWTEVARPSAEPLGQLGGGEVGQGRPDVEQAPPGRGRPGSWGLLDDPGHLEPVLLDLGRGRQRLLPGQAGPEHVLHATR